MTGATLARTNSLGAEGMTIFEPAGLRAFKRPFAVFRSFLSWADYQLNGERAIAGTNILN
ncbi:MAG TPA: hypothetical protein VJ836_01270 [Candidatus Saccharimonadales bacterium]|nr:hypothetical protein [Candidatus Saccharimonadales bacterium]